MLAGGSKRNRRSGDSVPSWWKVTGGRGLAHWLIAALVLGTSAVALAGGGAVIERKGGRARINWTRGLIIETGAAAGELTAPSPEVARVAAERRARQAAHARLAARAAGLVLADGRSVKAVAAGDPEVARRLEGAARRAVDLQVDYASDGSTVVTAGLPLEAIRLAVLGAGKPPTGPFETSALIVDARETLRRPALGLELAAGAERYAGPTVFFRGEEAALRDPRLGAKPLRARAHSRDRALLWLKEGEGGIDPSALARAREAGALVVILLPQ